MVYNFQKGRMWIQEVQALSMISDWFKEFKSEEKEFISALMRIILNHKCFPVQERGEKMRPRKLCL